MSSDRGLDEPGSIVWKTIITCGVGILIGLGIMSLNPILIGIGIIVAVGLVFGHEDSISKKVWRGEI